MAALFFASKNGLTLKKGDSSGLWRLYPKSFNNEVLIEELCYIKFKLDIELNEVVNHTVNPGFTQVAQLINTNRSYGRFYLLLDVLPASYPECGKWLQMTETRPVWDAIKAKRAKHCTHRNKGHSPRINANKGS